MVCYSLIFTLTLCIVAGETQGEVLILGCLSLSLSVNSYRTFVSEDAGPNTLVATVLAKDPDGDGITYKITTGNDEGNFVIDSQKGETYCLLPSLPLPQ